MMNPDEIRNLKKLIVTVAEYYGRDLKPHVVTMMAEDFNEFSYNEIEIAYRKYRSQDKQMRFPMPATIIDLIRPSVEPRVLAMESASRVIEAVGKYGWNNVADARVYIGTLGWRAVQRLGGWDFLCGQLGVTLQITTIQAQIRDLCEGTIKMGDAGMHDQAPVLPEKPQAQELERADFTKLLNKKETE